MISIDTVTRASTALILLTGMPVEATNPQPATARGLDPAPGKLSSTTSDAMMRLQELAHRYGADNGIYREWDTENFESKTMTWLSRVYKDDASFQSAVQNGTLKLKYAPDVEGLNARSEMIDLIKNGSQFGTIGNYSASDEWLNARRAEGGHHTAGTVDNLAYYASW